MRKEQYKMLLDKLNQDIEDSLIADDDTSNAVEQPPHLFIKKKLES